MDIPLLLAHTGHGSTSGFMHGLEHPIFGLDHLLAMVAVGLWAVQQGGKALWAVPASFVGLMLAGGAMGIFQVPLPLIEPGIMASILLLGLLVAFAVKMPVWASAVIVGMFALFHGHAHGGEMPENASGLMYALGFILSTAALHAAGIGAGLLLKDRAREIVVRAGGGVIAAWGLLIIAQSFA